MVVDSLISASKECDCAISAWCRQVCDLVFELGFTLRAVVSPKYSVPVIKIVSSVFSLADCTLEKQLSTEENWI